MCVSLSLHFNCKSLQVPACFTRGQQWTENIDIAAAVQRCENRSIDSQLQLFQAVILNCESSTPFNGQLAPGSFFFCLIGFSTFHLVYPIHIILQNDTVVDTDCFFLILAEFVY